MKKKVTDANEYFFLFSETVPVDFLDQVKDPGLNAAESNRIIMKNILPLICGKADNVEIVFRHLPDSFIIIHADPENKPAVRLFRITDHCFMMDPRRDHDYISLFQVIELLFNKIRDGSLQKKIKFIIIMSMTVHIRHMAVAVIIKLIVFREHILPGQKLGFQGFFHNFSFLHQNLYRYLYLF